MAEDRSRRRHRARLATVVDKRVVIILIRPDGLPVAFRAEAGCASRAPLLEWLPKLARSGHHLVYAWGALRSQAHLVVAAAVDIPREPPYRAGGGHRNYDPTRSRVLRFES